jgi:hypothetical protein
MTHSKLSITTDRLELSSMDEITIKLSIHHLTKKEADEIFNAAVDICGRTLSGSMEVEIERVQQKPTE